MIIKERYEIKDKIGRGRYSEVFKVLDKKDGKFYALKSIIKNSMENINDFIKNCKEGINLMESIKSEYIVKLVENFYDEKYKGYCIVMELCDGNLRYY